MTRRFALISIVAALLGSAFLSLQHAQEVQVQRGTGLIIGRVVDSAGAGVKNASVNVSGSVPWFRQPDGSPGSFLQIITDEDGEFALRDLPAAAFSFRVSREGYSEGAYGRTRPGDYARNDRFVLAAGERKTDLTITLWRHSTISGTVTDESGEPIDGAWVTVLQPGLSSGRPSFDGVSSRGGQTNDRGEYRLSGIAPGEYAVVARAPNAYNISASPDAADDARIESYFFLPQTYRVPGSGGRQLISVEGGQSIERVDFLLSLQSGFRVEGRVLGTNDESLSTILELVLETPSRTPEVDQFVRRSVGLKSDRSFEFTGVQPGTYLLRAKTYWRNQPDSYREGGVESVTQTSSGSSTSWVSVSEVYTPPKPILGPPVQSASMPVTVSGDISGLTLTLKPGTRLSGRIEFEGRTPGPDDRDRRQLQLQFAPGGDQNWLSRPQSEISEDGRFTTEAMIPGRYVLNRQTNSRWRVKSAMAGGRDLFNLPIDVGAEDLTDVVVVVTDGATHQRGKVTNVQGQNPNLRVVAFPTDTRLWTDYGSYSLRIVEVAVSDSGEYYLDLAAGEYWMLATSSDLPRLWQDPRFLTRLAAQATRVMARDGDQSLTLTAGPIR